MASRNSQRTIMNANEDMKKAEQKVCKLVGSNATRDWLFESFNINSLC